MVGPIEEVIGNHHRTGAAFGGVSSHSFEGLKAAYQLTGFNAGYNADLPAAAEIKPGTARIEVSVQFFEEERSHRFGFGLAAETSQQLSGRICSTLFSGSKIATLLSRLSQ
jgi:hypothetical protein